MTETVTSSPMKRLEDWKARLIDLSRKNNLLYFHKAKRGSLSITQPEPQKIFDSLIIKKNRLEFFIPQEEPKKPDTIEKPATVEETKRPSANQLVCGGLSRIDLERNLTSLERRSLLDYRERGVRILHAAFGTLNWVNMEKKEKVQSPLILVPLELTRDSFAPTLHDCSSTG